jgi:hypothetical protein
LGNGSRCNVLRLRLRKLLLWLNVVCLDAPLVAIAWQWVFAHCLHVGVSVWARAALFLTAWLIYLVDRLADAISLQTNCARSVRQQFCLLHKKLWLGLIPAVGLVDAAIVLLRLNRDLLISGACLSGIAAVYLAVNYAFSELWEIIPLKEITVGFLFSAGTLLVLIPKFALPPSTVEPLPALLAMLLFAILCSLNCMSIAVWERDLDRAQRKHSIATRYPGIGVPIRVSCIVVAVAALLLATLCSSLLPIAISLSVGASLLALLHFLPIGDDERTALADLVLLTPVAFLFAESLS